MPRPQSKSAVWLVIGVILLIFAIWAVIGAMTARADMVSNPFEGMQGVTGVQSSGGRNGLGSLGGLAFSGGCGLMGDEAGVVDMAVGGLSALFSGDLSTEMTQTLNGIHLVTQQCHQARMRLLADINAITHVVSTFETAIETGNAGLLVWGATAARDEYRQLFPDSMAGMSADQIVWKQTEQERAIQRASEQSKMTTGQLVEDLTSDMARMQDISRALDDCKYGGQTCTGDLNAQATVFAAQIQAKTVLLESTKARAVEAQQDYYAAAKQRSEAWAALMRGGGPGM
jgi:hypothetical protein